MHDAEFLDALQVSAADLMVDKCPAGRLHRHIAGDEPLDTAMWQTIAELGWPMLAVSEGQGGMAGGPAALAIVQEALGAHCAPLPFMGTALLATALGGWHDSKFAEKIAADIAQGQTIGGAGDMVIAPGLSAGLSHDGFLISGTAPLLDALGSDWIVVPVRDAADGATGLALLATEGLMLERRPVADRTRTVSTLRLECLAIAHEQCLFGPTAAPLLARLRAMMLLMLAADAAGGAGALLDLTVEYLKTRSQFGKPIGSFQALKHRIADCRTQLEMARVLVVRARECGDDDPLGPALATMAKLSACEAFHRISREAVQMHGGIGYTWEHQAHLYLKRATLDRALCGGPAQAQDLIGALLMEQAA